jgi:hypothetical protein
MNLPFSPSFVGWCTFRAVACPIFVLATLAGFGLAPTEQKAPFQWPDSSHYWRVLVNVNQYIENYPKEWFAQDKLVTDLAVRDIKPGERQRAIQRFDVVRQLLESRGLYVGTYVSGTTVGPQAEQNVYPPASVALETMPAGARYVGSWPGQPDRKIIDVTDPDTRHGLQAGIQRLWENVRAPIRFVDNAAVHRSAGRGQPWEAYCENMAEIRKIGEFQGSRVIFNISGHIGTFSDQEMTLLMCAVGSSGIALEMPWAPAIRQSAEATERAKARYRQLLDHGAAVIMIPVNTPEDALTAWVRGWREASDHLYMSGVFWKPPDFKVFAAP